MRFTQSYLLKNTIIKFIHEMNNNLTIEYNFLLIKKYVKN